MAYPVPTFDQIHDTIMAAMPNETGQPYPIDSDASIRADGTAAVAEGLYDHQLWIARQLFIRTADEQGLVLAAQRLNLPRLSSTLATGQVTTSGASAGIDLPQGSQLTDGNGYYWITTADATLSATSAIVVPIQAQAVGASWNKVAGSVLTWTSPVTGQAQSATVIELSGGTDGEALEAWRARLLAAEQGGSAQGSTQAMINAAMAVSGVLEVYSYPKRRGIGSWDIAVVAVGADQGGDLPSPALLAAVQAACIAASVANEDIVAYAPNAVPLNVSAVLTGNNINIAACEAVMAAYVANLQPAQPFIVLDLGALLLQQPGVTNAVITPSVDQIPVVSWQELDWYRPATMTATVAS